MSEMVKKASTEEIINHWILAVSCILLIITGYGFLFQLNAVGGLFGGSNAEAKPAKTASETLTPPTLRGSNTDLAAKPKRATPTPLAVANAAPQPKAQEAAKLKTVANATPPAQPQQASASAPEVRTAFSAPQPTDGLLAGAQPVVATGSFESRWSAFR